MQTGRTDEKRALRKAALVRRDHLTEAQRIEKSRQIAELLFAHPWYQNAEQLLVYASYLSEVSTEGIMRHALQAGKRVYCPVVTGKREMVFCKVVLSGLGAMEKDSHGIPQPDEKTCAHYVYEPEKSLMLMPGCVFNDQGDRIGYGGGFYDSFLAKQPMQTIALFFDCQHTEAQSIGESHDVRPDLILTESGFQKNDNVREIRGEHRMNEISKEQSAMLEEIGKRAIQAKYELQGLRTEQKNEALKRVADGLLADAKKILAANEQDMQKGKEHGMHEGLLDRLKLTDARIEAMAEGLRQVVALNDPIGTVIERFTHPNGMEIKQVRVPLGVIGIIYESRPNVTADAFGLCFKTGNAVILKGGSDAICSIMAITESIRSSLAALGICADAVQLITDTDRAVTAQFMKMNRYVDVLIPRGGAGLIRAVVEKASIPVIETGTGNCHIYIDQDADFKKAIPIIINAKTQRIGVCNACESLVIHEKIKDAFLPMLAEELKKNHVEMRADKQAAEVIGDCTAATEEDFAREYLDYIISIKTVGSAEEAIAHINRYHTGHSDSIITENKETAQRFLDGVDSACVYVNVSTRFTDGFEFGFGAEIGISTQKLHARGPMGLRELTSYKYQVVGDGQIRG